MKLSKVIPGVHIQWPWSQLLISGKKTVETRSYPLPKKYIGKELAIIETAGPNGKAKAGITKSRIIGIIIFSECFQYKTRLEWQRDFQKHQVPKTDPLFFFDKHKPKWGWKVSTICKLKEPVAAPIKRGIVFATACKV